MSHRNQRLTMPLLNDRVGAAEASEAAQGSGAWLVRLKPGVSERAVQGLADRLRGRMLEVACHDLGSGILSIGEARRDVLEQALVDTGVAADLIAVDTPQRLVRRDALPAGSRVRIGGATVGAGFALIGGPCAVESRAQIMTAARAAARAGVHVLRGGAFKPRTSPYAFQGLGMRGVELLAEAGRATGLPVVSEILDPSHLERMYPLVDAFQVGARNMQNFELLKALGDVDRPVLLKRGASATLEEWLLAAEYLLAGGNGQVILCERGIRTFNSNLRYTLDLATAVQARSLTHLPVIIDPSHATGRPELVPPLACAALAAGLDGVMFEFHPHPQSALSDGPQALHLDQLDDLAQRLSRLAAALGRDMEPAAIDRPQA